MTRSGGEILVAALRVNGVDAIYCVPGESYIAVLDALYDAPDVRVVTCRHEAAAANMAEADGKMTGRPGVAFVTRGPGATHASIGVHTAMQDSTPMLLFVGQVPRRLRGRDAFQEVDYEQMFGGLAKLVVEIDDARRIPEVIRRAFVTALAGRPGPVVISLPEDVLAERVELADIGAARAVHASPSEDDLVAFCTMLAAAERPLAILGGSVWDAEACAAMRHFAQRADLAVACSFRRQALFDNRDARYVGDLGYGVDPALAQRVRDADLIVAIGGRLGDVPTGSYTLIEAPRPRQRLVHVHPDPLELGRIFETALPINAAPTTFARSLDRVPPIDGSRWSGWTRDARRDYEAYIQPPPTQATLDLATIVHFLSERLPENAFITTGAGNFSIWPRRFFLYKRFGTQLAPVAGAMAYGVPAAVAAKLRHPDRVAVAFAGDGDFMMSGHELATAMQYRAAIVVIVINNEMLGTIRMHQERTYPSRTIATDLRNPDFVALARAYGAHASLVERTADFAPAFEAALASGLPALLELRVDPEQITPSQTLAKIREHAVRERAKSTRA
jgi:acetolactate synthase-1/2/3 large subunit